MTATAEKINGFLNQDLERIDALMEEYPDRIPINALADFLHMDPNSTRSAVEGGAFGFAWRRAGKANKVYIFLNSAIVIERS